MAAIDGIFAREWTLYWDNVSFCFSHVQELPFGWAKMGSCGAIDRLREAKYRADREISDL